MLRSNLPFLMLFISCLHGMSWTTPRVQAEETSPPNVVLIFIDDMGYADIGPFGGKSPTPNLDRMASEGIQLTNFCVSSAVCSASRSALMTGCLHRRISISGALGPNANIGLNPDETTLAEVCKSVGYNTACFGKWHLGHHPSFLPPAQGFDQYYGIPYSNDMWPLHPNNVAKLKKNPNAKPIYPPLPMIEGTQVVDSDVSAEEQSRITHDLTVRGVDFIQKSVAEEKPFFLYMPHPMVHVPLYAGKEFQGKSGLGVFADVVMELDWSVGEILKTLKNEGVDDNTLVIFTSDNGPWLSYGDHAGSAGDLREGKGTMFEGGYREPTLMRWPGVIPAGKKTNTFASTIDVLPTVAAWIGADLPEKKIDGKDIRAVLTAPVGTQVGSPHQAFPCYYAGGQLQAIRDARWKLHFPHSFRTLSGRKGGTGGLPVPYDTGKIGVALYDLESDPGETQNVLEDHPEVVARLEKAAEYYRQTLGDKLTRRSGSEIRPSGKLQPGQAKLTW